MRQEGVHLSRIKVRAVSRYVRGLQSAGSLLSESFDIWAGKIGINTLSTSATTATVTKTISWNPDDYELVSASLEVVATNSAELGGHLDSYVNETDVGTIGWGFNNTGSNSGTFDITSDLLNGSNSFYWVYNVQGALGASGYVTKSTVTVVLQYIGTGKQPTTPAISTNPLTGIVLTTTDYIIIGSAVVLLSLTGGVLLLRRKPSVPYYGHMYGPPVYGPEGRGGYYY